MWFMAIPTALARPKVRREDLTGIIARPTGTSSTLGGIAGAVAKLQRRPTGTPNGLRFLGVRFSNPASIRGP